MVHTSTGTSFEASSATGDAVNLYITDVTFSAITATTAVALHTTDAEMQIDPVTIFQVRHFANAAVVTDDIIAPMNVDHDYSLCEASIRFSENKDIGADDAHYVITAT